MPSVTITNKISTKYINENSNKNTVIHDFDYTDQKRAKKGSTDWM